jgi:hypothetical protein
MQGFLYLHPLFEGGVCTGKKEFFFQFEHKKHPGFVCNVLHLHPLFEVTAEMKTGSRFREF